MPDYPVHPAFHPNPVIEMLGPLLIITVLVLAPIIIANIVLRHRRQETDTRLRAALDFAERGQPVPPGVLIEQRVRRPGTGDLRAGMVLSSFGLGTVLFALTLPRHEAWGLGLLPLFAGLGFLITWKLGQKNSTENG